MGEGRGDVRVCAIHILVLLQPSLSEASSQAAKRRRTVVRTLYSQLRTLSGTAVIVEMHGFGSNSIAMHHVPTR